MIKGLWDYVKGEESKPWLEVDVAPDDTAEGKESIPFNYVPKEGYTEKDVDMWFTKDGMAKGLILNRLHSSIAASLPNAYYRRGTTAQELWNELTRKYGTPWRDEIVDEWRSFIHFV